MNYIYDTRTPNVEQFSRLFETTGWNREYGLNKEEFIAILNGSFFSVSVYLNNKLIGYGRVVSDGVLHAMIYEMIVMPEHQRQGVGSGILDMLVKRCRACNIRDIQLFCAKGKRRFYERYGFEPRPDDAPGMQLRCQKPLEQESP